MLLHQIGGYSEFLTRVEVDRLHRMQHPEWTPGSSTENLAYAVALDLHRAWEDYVANSNFHSGALQSGETRPLVTGTEPSGSGQKGGGAFLSALYWRIYVIVVVVAIVFDLLLPYGFDRFRIFTSLLVGSLLALYATPVFRKK